MTKKGKKILVPFYVLDIINYINLHESLQHRDLALSHDFKAK